MAEHFINFIQGGSFMFKSIRTAFHIKELRQKLLFTLLMVVLVWIGSQLPVPGIDASYFKQWFAQNSDGAFGIFSAFTGGSFENFSVFALGITPYITASIVIQLLTIVIQALEELQRDGKSGQKKMEWINRWTAVELSFAESIAVAYGFGKSGLIPNMSVLRGIIIVVFLTGGSGLMIFMGKWSKSMVLEMEFPSYLLSIFYPAFWTAWQHCLKTLYSQKLWQKDACLH